jgi:hypothetical protein
LLSRKPIDGSHMRLKWLCFCRENKIFILVLVITRLLILVLTNNQILVITLQKKIKKIGELYGRFFLGIRTLVVEHGDSSPFTSNGQRVKG